MFFDIIKDKIINAMKIRDTHDTGILNRNPYYIWLKDEISYAIKTKNIKERLAIWKEYFPTEKYDTNIIERIFNYYKKQIDDFVPTNIMENTNNYILTLKNSNNKTLQHPKDINVVLNNISVPNLQE